MGVIHGKDIKIYSNGGTLIACAKSCSIHKDCETIETASTNQTDKTFITGRSSWSIALSYLVASGLQGIPMVGSSYSISVMVSGSQAATGTAICTECRIDATMGNLSQGSIKLQGTGPLT